jgi:hypothetical protein
MPQKPNRTPQQQLQAMVAGALRLYRRALRGDKVTVSAQKAAADVLKAAGLIGDNAQAPALPANIRVQFLPMRLDEHGNPVVDEQPDSQPADSACAEPNAGCAEPGEVPGGNGGPPVG